MLRAEIYRSADVELLLCKAADRGMSVLDEALPYNRRPTRGVQRARGRRLMSDGWKSNRYHVHVSLGLSRVGCGVAAYSVHQPLRIVHSDNPKCRHSTALHSAKQRCSQRSG